MRSAEGVQTMADTALASRASGAGAGEEVHEFSAQTLEAQERHAKLMQQMEAQRRARTISVPTLDSDVRTKLRDIGRPITLFGEKPENRRDRLRRILAEVRLVCLSLPAGVKMLLLP